MEKFLKNFVLASALCVGLSVHGQTYNMTNSVVTTCSGNFYDDGGSASNYGVNQDLIETFTSSTAGYRIRVSFSAFSTELGYDTLSVYDGTSVTVTNFKNKFSGTAIPANQYSSAQSLTFHFKSDAATVNPGWTASVTCFGIANITPVTASQSKNITITVNGSNTTFNTPPFANNVFLVHTVSTATITGNTPTIVSDVQLTSSFNIPCNADIGMYDLYVDQPGVGLTKIANAFNVTNYQLNLTTTPPSCFGLSNGSISALVTGGSPSYTYYWQPGSMVTQNVSGLAAGNYTCTVTDGSGCQRIQTTTLTQPPLLNATTSVTNVICFGTSNGAIAITPTGGTPAYTYNWSPVGGTAALASGLSAGSYTCTITDANACVKTISVNVNQPSALNVNAGSDVSICEGSNTFLSSSASGGSPSYVYSWAPSSGLSTPFSASTNCSPVATTIYTITATDANGCTVNDNVVVTVNSLPSASATTSGTLTCATNTVDVIATGALMYYWDGPGVVSGVGNSNAVVNQPGIYTVTATGSNGCNAYVTTIVTTDYTTPNITANGGTICEGASYVITASGASSYSWNTGATTYSINVTPTATTVYTVNGTGANGCMATYTVLITVNPSPVITITPSNATICSGGTSTLSASGALTYNWNTAEVTSSIIVSPTITTTYSLTGVNATGCSSTASVLIAVAANKSLTGSIINETAGDVILYKYSSVLSQWDSVTYVPISSTAYQFNNLDSGQYVLKVIPATPNNQITYGTSFISWQDATVINHGCTSTSINTITVIPLTNIGTGTGSISGTIVEADGFGQRSSDFKPMAPGNPIGGIVVKGGRNPGGQMFAQTTTDGNGDYTLSNIPDGSNYFILVDIPGLDTNYTYHFNLSPGNNQLTGLDFTVDSMFVNPILNFTSVNDINVQEHQLAIYPNPTSEQININYNLKVNSSVSIELFDIAGRSIKTLLPLTTQTIDKYKNTFQITDLNSGMYFIKLKINDKESTVKLFVTN